MTLPPLLGRGRLRKALVWGVRVASWAHGAFASSGWKMRLLTAGLLLVVPLCTAFYLPGLAPVSFCEEGEETEGCKVRALTGGPDAGGLPRPRFPHRGNPQRGEPRGGAGGHS